MIEDGGQHGINVSDGMQQNLVTCVKLKDDNFGKNWTHPKASRNLL